MKDASFVGSVAIDIDGTVCKDLDWDLWCKDGVHYFPPIQDGARESLEELRDMGFRIIIHTCRLSPTVNKEAPFILESLIRQMLMRNMIPFDEIWMESGKPLAHFYVDDRGIHHDGSWERTMAEIKKRLKQ